MEQQYQNSSGAEDFEDYGPEGYHPTFLGQKFNYRYTVLQKLGWGHFSTVWLVEAATNPTQYLALKIQRSKPSHTEAALDQLNLLKTLREFENSPQWLKLLQDGFGCEQLKSYVDIAKIYRPLTLVDQFAHFGMHGKHQCSVFELMGPNLLDLIQHYEYKHLRMPLKMVKKITRDILIGLVYMHQVCHMIHTDLKPENVMITLTAEQQSNFVQRLRAYKKKPISMKYLYKLRAKNPQKNRKKYDKKKLKKKAAKEQQKNENQLLNEENQEQPLQAQITQKMENVSQSVPTPEVIPIDTQKNQNNKKIPAVPVAEEVIHPTFQTKNKKKKKKNNKSEHPQKIIHDNQVTKDNKTVNKNNNYDLGQKDSESEGESNESSSSSGSQIPEYTQQEISNLKWKNISIDLRTQLHCKIVDFGNACMENHHFTEDIQTRQYRSPQVIIGHHYQPNTDIWSLACVIYEMLTNSYLFKPKDKHVSKDQDHLYKMMELLGPIPKQFCMEGSHSKKFFNKKGDLLNGCPKKILSISVLLEEDYNYDKEEAHKIESFLKPMLEYEPHNRISALQALQHPWLWKD